MLDRMDQTPHRARETPLDVRYALTVDDLVDGQRLVQRRFRMFVALVGIVFAIAGVGIVVAGNIFLGGITIIYGVVDLAILQAGRPIERFGMRRRAARLIDSPSEVSLTGSAVHFRYGETTGEIAYSDLTGVREDAKTFGLASASALRLWIPKRAFGSEDTLTAFRQQVLASITAAKTGAAAP